MELKAAKNRGYYLEHQGEILSSKIDPIAEAERLFSSIEPRGENEVFLLLGFSPLYHIPLLAKKSKKVFVIDPRVENYQFLEFFRKDLDDLFKEIEAKRVVLIPNLQFLEEVVSKENLGEMRIIDTVSKNNSDQFLKEIALWKAKLLEIFRVKVKTKLTETYFEVTWFKNALENVGRLLEAKNAFFLSDFEIKKRKAFVLISSGVFLEKDVQFLRENRDVLYIVAVVSTFFYLDKEGIIPDVLISSDGGFYNTYHFRSLFESGKNIPLIAPISLCKSIAHYDFKPVYYYFDDESVMLHLLKEGGLEAEEKKYLASQFLPMNPSVIINGLYLMKYWGLKKIYFSGLDFCLEPFRYHCDGNVSEEILFQRSFRTMPFETKFHELYYQKIEKFEGVWTTDILTLYREEFNKVARRLDIEAAPLKNFDGRFHEILLRPLEKIPETESLLLKTRALYAKAYQSALEKYFEKRSKENVDFFRKKALQWVEE